jgi:hypothetical protein
MALFPIRFLNGLVRGLSLPGYTLIPGFQAGEIVLPEQIIF